jgi:hypothetical protein
MTGKRPSALNRLAAAKPVATPGVEPAAATTPQRRDGTTARRHGKYTVIVYDDLVTAFDRLALEMSEQLGRRVDKAEIVRALIAAAAEPVPAVRLALLDVLGVERYRETRGPAT